MKLLIQEVLTALLLNSDNLSVQTSRGKDGQHLANAMGGHVHSTIENA